MKVAYIVERYPSLSERFIVREISALAAINVEVIVFAIGRGHGQFPDKQKKTTVYYRPSVFSITSLCSLIYYAINRPYCSLRTLCRLMRNGTKITDWLRAFHRFLTATIYARRAKQAGVLHVHAHFAFFTADIAFAMAELLGLSHTVSVHAHDIYVQDKQKLAGRTLRADAIVACTEHGKESLLQKVPAMTENLVFVVRHGLFPEEWTPILKKERSLILSAGRLVPKKGFSVLLESCKVLAEGSDHKFSCVIAGDGLMKEHLIALAEKNGLSDIVSFAGEFSEREFYKMLERALLFVMPSIVDENGDRDGMPNVVIEAMSVGVPVIVSNASAAPEVVKDGVHGYIVEAGNAGELTDRISRLLQNPGLCVRMGAEGRALVEEKFNIGKNIRKLAELFEKVRKK